MLTSLLNDLSGFSCFQGQPQPSRRTSPAAPPDYQPPPPYSPGGNRVNSRRAAQNASHYSSSSSYDPHNSFADEAPSSDSSYRNYPTRPPWSSSTVGENSPRTARADMYSFNEEEPSFSSEVLRPPSYHEATSQLNGSSLASLGNAVHHVFQPSTAPVSVSADNSSGYPEYSPPPQYTPEPEGFSGVGTRVASETVRQSVGSRRTELIGTQRSGPVIRVSEEEARKYEDRVRQLQRERLVAERKAHRAPIVVPQAPTIPRTSSSDSLASSRSTHSVQSSQTIEEDDLEDDPMLEKVRRSWLMSSRSVSFAVRDFTFYNKDDLYSILIGSQPLSIRVQPQDDVINVT